MGERVVVVDAFSAEPFRGNPAAVCLLTRERDADWMQAVARELNLPATAFVLPGTGEHGLRWFSPTIELALCGHGTLASAHVLWEDGVLPRDAPARFATAAGPLRAEWGDGWIELDFPAEPEQPAADAPAGLARALGVAPRYVGRNRLDYLVEVEGEEAVRGVQPDFGLLATVPTRGVIVTSRAARPGVDFVSRFFAPRAGIPEDMVTGSAHCALGPFWSARLGRDALVGEQVSPRGGRVRVRPRGGRVVLGGQAVTVLRGELT